MWDLIVSVPDHCLSFYFVISVEGILKLLKNLKSGKAASPDKLKFLLLQELREEIAPILKIIFERSLQTGELPAGGCRALVTSVFKRGTNHRLQTTDRSPTPVHCVRSSSNLVGHMNSHDLLYGLWKTVM